MKSWKEYQEAMTAPDAPPSPRTTSNRMYAALPGASGQILFDAQRVMTTLIDKYPGDVRRLVRKALAGGEFDGDPGVKEQMESLLKSLSGGTARTAARRANRMLSNRPHEPKHMVSRPTSDSPGGEGGGDMG